MGGEITNLGDMKMWLVVNEEKEKLSICLYSILKNTVMGNGEDEDTVVCWFTKKGLFSTIK